MVGYRWWLVVMVVVVATVSARPTVALVALRGCSLIASRLWHNVSYC